MKIPRNTILARFALGLLAAAALVSSAAAQEGYKGSFTLPNDVRWQNQNLPAGDYTFRMSSTAVPATTIITGPDGAVVVGTAARSLKPAGERSFLVIERRGASRFVRELYLAHLGVHFRYQVPKIPKEELAQAQPTTERVLVALAK